MRASTAHCQGKYARSTLAGAQGSPWTCETGTLLLAQNPRKRPTVSMILKKPFIQEHIQQMEQHKRVNAERAIMDLSAKSLKGS